MGFFNNDDKHNNLSIDIFGKKLMMYSRRREMQLTKLRTVTQIPVIRLEVFWIQSQMTGK